MNRDVLIEGGALQVRVAVLDDGALAAFWMEPFAEEAIPRAGDIVLGRVQRAMRGIDAAFVDIGTDRAGFLAGHDAGGALPPEGEAVLVQIIKEPIGGKGARLSTAIAIPGQRMVFLPGGKGIALSRRIGDAAERARLSAVMRACDAEGAGYIVRTAAAGASATALAAEANGLAALWRTIADRRRGAAVPSVLHREIGPVERALRDETGIGVRRIVIDGRQEFAAARAYAARAMPELLSCIVLHDEAAPLFETFGIEDSIASLASPRVALPSGGWITIETTEALTAIDVNSGRHPPASGIEATSLAVNLEAAEMVARQLALRGIGGLIVVDFIHLSEPANVERLMTAFRAAVARDPTPSEILPMSAFGVVEMTRKRVRDPLNPYAFEPCPTCDGTGRQNSMDGAVMAVLRAIERAARAAPERAALARVAPALAQWFEAHDSTVRAGLARRGVSRWSILAEAGRGQDQFDVETT